MRGDTGDVYWRRRMSVLVAVLVVVAVVAWACSSGDDGPQRASSAQTVTSGSPAADPLLAGLPTVTLSPSASPSPKHTKSAAKPTPSPKPRKPGEPCEENDLVLNLQGRQETYAGRAKPNFMLTLVNTGPVMCTADVGPRTMEIRITSGSDRVWSTSDCISGEGVELRKMERGIPYVRSLDWDRRRSSDNCQGTRADAMPGTYVAVVRAFGMRSPKAVFLLR